MTENPLLEMQRNLAEILGVPQDKVTHVQPQWLQYMKSGVLVELHVGRWRGRSKLTYADLGLPDPRSDEQAKTLGELLSLGKKNLLPARYLRQFDSIEIGGRKIVADNGTRTYWGSFITAQRFRDKVKYELERMRGDYFSLMGEMIDNFDQVKAELADEYRHQARLAYRRLVALAPDLVTMSSDEFVDGFVAGVLAIIPPKAEIEASFVFDWDLRYIPLPDLLAESNQRAAVIDAETHLEYERLTHERRMNEIEEEVARRKARIQIDAEGEIAMEIARKAQAEKDEQVTRFMRDLTVNLRQMVYDVSTDVMATLDKNNRLHPRSVIQLRNLIEAVDQMNFFGDRDVDAMIAQVQRQMEGIKVAEEKDPAAMRETLGAIATLTRQTLIQMGETPRSARSVGVSDVPAIGDIRRARTALSLDVSTIQPTEAHRKARNALDDI
jgi:hypothetical protein